VSARRRLFKILSFRDAGSESGRATDSALFPKKTNALAQGKSSFRMKNNGSLIVSPNVVPVASSTELTLFLSGPTWQSTKFFIS